MSGGIVQKSNPTHRLRRDTSQQEEGGIPTPSMPILYLQEGGPVPEVGLRRTSSSTAGCCILFFGTGHYRLVGLLTGVSVCRFDRNDDTGGRCAAKIRVLQQSAPPL